MKMGRIGTIIELKMRWLKETTSKKCRNLQGGKSNI